MSPLAARLAGMGLPIPALHVVLGSGYSAALSALAIPPEWKERGVLPFSALPSLPSASVQGHSGNWRYYEHARTGQVLCLQVGRLHGYEGHSPRQVVQTVMEAFMAGTRDFVLTNAAGSLTRTFKPGSAMIIRDHVNFTGQSPLYGPNPCDHSGKALGPRFPDMSQAWDKDCGTRLKKCLDKRKVTTHEGVYLGLLGPQFETPAEVKLFGKWGLHAVGMSTVWELLALKHAGARVCGLSMISNLGCGLSSQPLSHQEVEETGRKAAAGILLGIFDYAKESFDGKKSR